MVHFRLLGLPGTQFCGFLLILVRWSLSCQCVSTFAAAVLCWYSYGLSLHTRHQQDILLFSFLDDRSHHRLYVIDNDKSLRRLKRCLLWPLVAAQFRFPRMLFQVPAAVVANPSQHLPNLGLEKFDYPRREKVSDGFRFPSQRSAGPGRRIAGPSKCPWRWQASTGTRNGDWNSNHPQSCI